MISSPRTSTSVTDVADLASHVRRNGGAQILVHTAGGSAAPAGGFAALSDQDWADELSLNLLAAVRLDRALLPMMIEAGSGAVVHIGSIQSRMPLYDGNPGVCGGQGRAAGVQQGPGE